MLADIRRSNEPLDGWSIRPGECPRREPRALPPQAPQGQVDAADTPLA